MTKQAFDILLKCEPWQRAFHLQKTAMSRFYRFCSELLEPACALQSIPEEYLSMKRNLFSTLFLLALEAAGVAETKRPLYALVNQCLRAQVTGCDNLLDDEYKSVIPFALEGEGIRFRSVLTIMTADAILGALIAEEVAAGRFDPLEAKRLLKAVLAVLIPSGIEEHEEESQQKSLIPSVEQMLEEIHYRKTGLLFEAPVRLAEQMGDTEKDQAGAVAQALASFGIGCQILDDLKDVADDLVCGKYNLVVSMACFGFNSSESDQVRHFVENGGTVESARLLADELVEAKTRCFALAVDYFQRAQQAFSCSMPAFGLEQASALGVLVQGAIMADRNELALRGLS